MWAVVFYLFIQQILLNTYSLPGTETTGGGKPDTHLELRLF